MASSADRGGKRRAGIALLLAVVLLAASAGAWWVWPGPVYWVDLYWTALIESGVVDPHQDRYPWTVAVDWSPDGRTIVSAGYQPDVLLWDARSGKLRRRLKGHRVWVQEAIFSPDGARIASADWDGVVLIWDARSGRRLQRLKAEGDLFSVAFHPSRPLLAAGSSWGHVTVFDLRSGAVVARRMSNPGGVLYLGYSWDGKLLVTAGEDTQIRLLDGKTLQQKGQLTGHRGGVTSFSFVDSHYLLSCGDDGTIRLWDLKGKEQRTAWDSGARWVNFCAPWSGTFLTADSSGAVREWQYRNPARGQLLVQHDDWAQCVRMSRDGVRFASAGKAGEIKIYNRYTNRVERSINVGAHLE